MHQFGVSFVCVLAFCLIAVQVDAKIYERCALARELLKYGFPKDKLDTWLCIIQHESNYNTAAINTQSGDHGIFQINQVYWCNPPGKGCGVTCAAMRNDDISDDAKCALKIYNDRQRWDRNGFKAWSTYPKCSTKAQTAPYLKGC